MVGTASSVDKNTQGFSRDPESPEVATYPAQTEKASWIK